MPSANPTCEFHISRKSRDKFNFDDTFFSITGDVVFYNSHAAQLFASKINEKRKSSRATSGSPKHRNVAQVSGSDINAMGLFHEVLHFVIDSYVRDNNQDAFSKLEDYLKSDLGEKEVSRAELAFVQHFPPTSVYRKKEEAAVFVAGADNGISRRQLVLVEMLLLWLENRNPAFSPISDLIDDSVLKERTTYEKIIVSSDAFFDTQPKYGPANSSLLKMLLGPIEAHPDSIMEQLSFIVKNWESIIGKSPYLMRLLGAIDFIKEEGKYFLMLAQAQAEKARIPVVRRAGFEGFGDREAQPVLTFRGSADEHEAENFTPDLSWMPRLVLIAKNALVWLDQLSKKYQRAIMRLDQIPDEELEILSRRGFTGLWLIGIWVRSKASQKIKHLNGNSDAIASAYSLDSYDVAQDIGGENAYRDLRDRASRFGIRLASDMVPNHMGIDSSWVINHPDWFLKSDYPPYPNYSFNGPDLSSNDRVGVFIEDGYWSKRDAAVVFKRTDRWTGDAKYIYHGNDGTHMPWNDTAQLDFTKPEVREAVIQTILHVARMFPIIRFDAAMVLSKKHYQRLWFPEPGTGGAIPSRSNYSMTKEQFDAAMPVEFWREVVDRVQKEAPDTLLLAEAFWLMEGYFVRTLGMHRVYNSAFMNMLKREENSNYRQVIKNILEYNPQILKRFVNFVNNPDEDTAIAQFGKDDKYFGVCLMMSTMPGLPMFGHGQIEGLTEKYGMEFKRAYRDERPDEGLVARHEREIFPLLRMRQLFSEVDKFLLYDFFAGDGTVNEDVFVYSNASGSERTLVVYNNRYSHAAGWIKTSVAFREASGDLIRKSLAEGLSLSPGRSSYCIFRDLVAGVEYIRSSRSLRQEGLYVELGAYKYNVFVDFRGVQSSKEMPYDELCRELNGRGVGSVEEELLNVKLREVHSAFYEAMNAGSLRFLVDGMRGNKLKEDRAAAFEEKLRKLVVSIGKYEHIPPLRGKTERERHARYEALLSLPVKVKEQSGATYISRFLPGDESKPLSGWRLILLWLVLKEVVDSLKPRWKRDDAGIIDQLRLRTRVRNCFAELGVEPGASDYDVDIVREILAAPDLAEPAGEPLLPFVEMLKRDSARSLIAVHYYDGVRWFNRERFIDLLGYFVITRSVEYLSSEPESSAAEPDDRIGRLFEAASKLERAAARSGYNFDTLLLHLESE